MPLGRGKLAPEEVVRLIELCRALATTDQNPFELNVRRALETLRRYLPEWRRLDELLLDAEALAELARIIQLQGEWIRHRASGLYIDPLLVELKLRLSTPEELARCFVQSWHPISRFDQLTPQRLRAAMDYWNRLLPLSMRLGIRLPPPVGGGLIAVDELMRLGALSPEEFQDQLQRLWREIRAAQGGEGRVEYYAFLSRPSFQETVLRAYLVAFLVSEGHAELLINPLEETVHLRAREGPAAALTGPSRAIVTALNFATWAARRAGEDRGGS